MMYFKHCFFILIIILPALSGQVNAQGPCPCCTPEYRQFDFWLGDWNVTAKGKEAGENTIVLSQDSCILIENWISATPGYTGTSMNYYDKSEGKWHQLWLDNQGGKLDIKGGIVNGAMVMQSEPEQDSSGVNTWHEITWTPNKDGSVRQLWRQYSDSTDEPTVLFDGLYQRQE